MEEKMKKSATSTARIPLRFAHLCRRAVLLSILVSCPSTLPAVAQEGETTSKATTPIATTDTNLNISGAALADDKAEPIAPAAEIAAPGAVKPQMIVKTFFATAYCLKGQTAAGIPARRGMIAADPKILPLGSIVRIEAGSYSGIYTVMDTGGAVRGQRIDVYLPTRAEAIRFGGRRVKVEVLRRGWEPGTETPASSE
jgi:3D (Asp-Asp-Asp) domain-containing protein